MADKDGALTHERNETQQQSEERERKEKEKVAEKANEQSGIYLGILQNNTHTGNQMSR